MEHTHEPSENTSDSEWTPPVDDPTDSDDISSVDSVEVALRDAVENDRPLRDYLRSSGEMTQRVEEDIEESPGDANFHISQGSTRAIGEPPRSASSTDWAYINEALRTLPIAVAGGGLAMTNDWVLNARVVTLPDGYRFLEVDPSIKFDNVNNQLVLLKSGANQLEDTNLGLWEELASMAEVAQHLSTQLAEQPAILRDLTALALNNENLTNYFASRNPNNTPAEQLAFRRDITARDPDLINEVVEDGHAPSVAGSVATPVVTVHEITGEAAVRMAVNCAMTCSERERKAKWWCGGPHCPRLDQSKHLCGRCVTAIMTPWFLEGAAKSEYEARDENGTNQLHSLCEDLRRAEDAGNAEEAARILGNMRAEGIGGIPGIYGKRQCPFCRTFVVGGFVQVTNGYLLPQ